MEDCYMYKMNDNIFLEEAKAFLTSIEKFDVEEDKKVGKCVYTDGECATEKENAQIYTYISHSDRSKEEAVHNKDNKIDIEKPFIRQGMLKGRITCFLNKCDFLSFSIIPYTSSSHEACPKQSAVCSSSDVHTAAAYCYYNHTLNRNADFSNKLKKSLFLNCLDPNLNHRKSSKCCYNNNKMRNDNDYAANKKENNCVSYVNCYAGNVEDITDKMNNNNNSCIDNEKCNYGFKCNLNKITVNEFGICDNRKLFDKYYKCNNSNPSHHSLLLSSLLKKKKKTSARNEYLSCPLSSSTYSEEEANFLKRYTDNRKHISSNYHNNIIGDNNTNLLTSSVTKKPKERIKANKEIPSDAILRLQSNFRAVGSKNTEIEQKEQNVQQELLMKKKVRKKKASKERKLAKIVKNFSAKINFTLKKKDKAKDKSINSASNMNFIDISSKKKLLKKHKMSKKLLCVTYGLSCAHMFLKKDDTSYNPYYIDNPRFLQGKHHTLMKMNCYNVSIIPFVQPNVLKDEINEQFREMHPWIHKSITLSKLRNLKRDLFGVLEALTFLDISTVASAWVYFEKLVLCNVVKKTNRKLYAGTCLVLSYKFNQKSERKEILEITSQIQKFDKKESLSSRQIFTAEFLVFALLKFSLHLKFEDIIPHIQLHLESKDITFEEVFGTSEKTYRDVEAEYEG